MADSKLSALPTGAAIADADLFYSDQSAASVKQPASAVATYLISKTGIGSAVTGGTAGSVLFIGSGSVLAQDNANFFWDDTNFFLKVGHSGTKGAYYLNGLPAIFEVPNAGGNNWFEGNAGNTTLTGSANFGTGDGALAALTTGFNNVGVGQGSLGSLTTGVSNFGFGTNASFFLTTGGGNTAIGTNALSTCVSGNSNIAIGNNALQKTLGSANTGVGAGSLEALTGDFNVGIGYLALNTAVTGLGNTCIGPYAGTFITGGNQNTLVGGWSGPSGSISNVIALTNGVGFSFTSKIVGVDYNYTISNTWSFQAMTSSIGLHVYNTTDSLAPPTNYERACLDWNLTSNTFRLASQAGGTGTVRIIAIDAFSKAGAPANTDLPSGTWALIDDTTNNQTWLVFNKAGTIRKVQLT